MWNPRTKTLTVTVNQTQKPARLVTQAFRLPMEIEFNVAGETVTQPFEITKRTQVFTFKLSSKPSSVKLDPELKVPVKQVKVRPIV